METSTEFAQKDSYKRKRKKSFLKNARKYGKRGYYGRGSQLDAETYQYFIRIMEVYKEGFSTNEEKSMLVNNVFAQTENAEINCSSNQVGCRVIQQLLPFANDYHLECYMDAFVSNLRPLACDRFASHVLQTLLEISCKKCLLNDTEDKFREKCKITAIKVSRFLLNNLEDYIWDTYGNHVIRTVFVSLAQLQTENVLKHTKKPDDAVIKSETVIELPKEFVEIVKDYAERLIVWPQFSEFAYSELTSGLLQSLLNTLKSIDRCLLKRYLKKLLKECFAKKLITENHTNTNLPEQFLSKSVIMLLELALEIASPKLFNKIFSKCFRNRLVLMATTRNTNFAVQKLLSHCSDKELFETMFDEMSGSFQQILDAGHSGVILTVAETCKRLVAKQGMFIQDIMKLWNCFEPEDRQNSIVLCLCKFINYDVLPKVIDQEFISSKLNLHGVLIIQRMLEFNKPIKIINSILNNNPANLKSIFLNIMGSHIVDSYMNSKFIGENSREKLIRLLQGTYQELATSKYGSRSFEAIWNVAHLKQRLMIMNELSYKDALWSNSEYGKIIASKINLPLYKKNIEEWKNWFNKMSTKQ